MSYFINTYGGDLNSMGSGLGAVQRAVGAGLSIGQIENMARSEGVTFVPAAQQYLRDQSLLNARNSFQKQLQQALQQQSSQFAEQQRIQRQKMEQLQQQSLESQTRQAAPTRSAQVLSPGNSLVIRPGASNRFSRPELQLKSMNIGI